ncbi:serine hydroxymethyltransferase [Candidatus Roizmanbacteria bacterium]|nr:serine hydroxymethyltransferase [Candidatus Roizmanbacteria bacterium]
MSYLKQTDPEIFELIKKEKKRQETTLMMIASENTASKAVEEAVGSCLGNKYAEGYAFKRYYQGQENVDQIETLVVERAKALYGVPYANVQPYSGSPANLEVYSAIMNPGDLLMGLSLSFGGHLTHGANASMTSKFFKSVSYELGKDGFIDYDEVEKLALLHKPKVIVTGITAYPRIVDWKRFGEIAEKIGAYVLADISHLSGLVVGGAYPSPVPYVHIVTTTTHKTLRGPRGAMIMVTQKGLDKDAELSEKIAKAVFPGLQGGPHINTIAGIGVALREASQKSFKTYAKQIIKNAQKLGEELKKYDFDLISGGTDSHLLLIDLRNKDLSGKTVAEACEAVGIVFNYNSVPFDTNPPFYPSGIRVGTPGITSRGLTEIHMKQIARWIHEVVSAVQKTKNRLQYAKDGERKKEARRILIAETQDIKRIRKEVLELCKTFPLLDTYK